MLACSSDAIRTCTAAPSGSACSTPILLAPVIALPLLFVVSLALASMVMLLVMTGAAVALTIMGDVARRIWRQTRQPVVIPRRALG